jgi:pimeloyl-ACP methyl ester carboxylesterase
MHQAFAFNPASDAQTVINLACANGFTPQTYTPALAPLFERYRVLSAPNRQLWPDAPPSSLTNWHQLGDDLLAQLDAITDQPVIGIGHSVGGVAMMYAAIKRPQRFSKLILIEPTMISPRYILWILSAMRLVGMEGRVRIVQGALKRRREWPSKDEAFNLLSAKPLFKYWEPAAMRAYIETGLRPAANGVELVISPEWDAQIFKTLATDVWSLPQRLTVPTMVIHGGKTNIFTPLSARLFQQRKRDARMELISDAGHMVPQEQPAAVTALLHSFLS